MGPENALPISPEFGSPEEYVDSLLEFVASSDLLHTLCGGVHVLDFFTRKPDLYTLVIPPEWRSFFKAHDIMDLLDLFMREDLQPLQQGQTSSWREGPSPPQDLLEYVQNIRKFSLCRDFVPITRDGTNSQKSTVARNVAVGMNVKKIHEVDHFARYIEKLTAEIADSQKQEITHLVDFGSGQNYLGRALACEPYNKHIVAVEGRKHNIEGARNWDIRAKIAPKQKVMRNKKEFRAQQKALEGEQPKKAPPPPDPSVRGERGFYARNKEPPPPEDDTGLATLQISNQGAGSIQYIEHYLKDGDLHRVVNQIVDQDAVRERVSSDMSTTSPNPDDFIQGALKINDDIKATDPHLMVISLHSCGNLVHHGIRSLILNPAVKAVALIGCCYNLITERLGPPTYKIPSLRNNNARLLETTSARDPHGFPMCKRLCAYESRDGKGLRLNITARMMAVQAPQNWGSKDSEQFFKRHFYRALLQKMFLDRGVVQTPKQEDIDSNDGSPLGWSGGTAPIIIGSLRKSCYTDFVAYVRGVMVKLLDDNERGEVFREKMGGVTDEEIKGYEVEFEERGKELSVIWSLMAFSAGVMEAVIVVDRWMFLNEQEGVERAWVEAVFGFELSPRNLVVVGIKK